MGRKTPKEDLEQVVIEIFDTLVDLTKAGLLRWAQVAPSTPLISDCVPSVSEYTAENAIVRIRAKLGLPSGKDYNWGPNPSVIELTHRASEQLQRFVAQDFDGCDKKRQYLSPIDHTAQYLQKSISQQLEGTVDILHNATALYQELKTMLSSNSGVSDNG